MVDLFLFLLDSRIPETSLQLAEPYLSRMNRVYVLTKADLADPEVTYHWVKKFGTQGSPAFAVESNTGRGVDDLIAYLEAQQASISDRAHPEAIARPLRTMLFGLPNVGKSSLANRLLGTSKAAFGARPGLTRGSHWLRRGLLEILDTPGVIDTSQAKGEVLYKLAATWAVRDNQYDEEEVAFWLAKEVFDKPDPVSFITGFGRSRGFLGPGGQVDFGRASKSFIQCFREGKFGRISIEKPDTQ
jgi:ribosome biogenesis GTPase A